MLSSFGSTLAFDFNPFTTMAAVAQWGVVQVLALLIKMIEASPEPHLTAAWFRGEYGVILKMSLYLLVPIIFAATISSLLRGGLQAVLRTYLWALPIGVFGGVVAIALIEIAIDIDNELTKAVFATSKDTTMSFFRSLNEEMGQNFLTDATFGQASWAWSFAILVLMLPMFALVVMLVVEMFFREIMIYMAAMFIPFSLAAYVWGPIRTWFYSLCELIVTMVFAKFVIAAIISFGLRALAYGVTGNGDFSTASLAVLIGALVVFTIACLSGPVLVAFIMSPGHAILSFKAAKQLTPWNHDRKFAAQLVKSNYDGIKRTLTSAGKQVA